MTRKQNNCTPNPIWTRIRTFLISDDGPTAVEYCVILGLIMLAIISSVTLLANETANSFDDSANSIQNAMGS